MTPRGADALRCFAAACAVAIAPNVLAANPLNSSDRTTESSSAASAAQRDREEFNIVPVVGGTSDVGVGGGAFANLAHLRPGFDPYVWNIDMAAFITFKVSSDGWKIPYQDIYALFTIPRFAGTVARLELRPSYTWESTLGYYGLGNASPARSDGAPDSRSWYGRLHPAFAAHLRWPLADHAGALVGLRYTQNWLQIDDASKLAQDIRSGSPEVKDLIGPTGPHGVALFIYGLQWDDRDSEVSSHRGSFTEAQVKLSPGGTSEFPYRYAQASLVARAFVPICGRRVTLALRAVGDVLVGDPPFYELARFDDTYALGGENGVRGVPGQRYYGKVKVFGNAEVRSEILTFRALGKPLVLGTVAFFDSGRVWADTSARPELDGVGLGLKYGVGGGLRLQSGETFVLRADVAWSPDARPIGGYLGSSQTF